MTAWKVHGTSDDQLALRSSLVAALDRRRVSLPKSAVGTHTDRQLWAELCHGLGLGDLATTPPDSALSPTALLATCFEEFGARLAPVPALASFALAAPAVMACDGVDDAEPWWSAIRSGSGVAALVRSADHVLSGDLHDRPTISGSAAHVVDGATADVLLVVARKPAGGTCLVEVDITDPERVRRRRETTFDLTRELATVTMTDAPVRLIGNPDLGARLHAVVDAHVSTLLAAEQLGVLRASLELAVEHAKTRFQFGRSIGSFQVIKHRLADMYLAMELTRTAVVEACRAIDGANPDAGLWATIAHHTASINCTRVTTQSLQVHGGLGFTWEHPAHLFLKRAKSSEVLVNLPSERTQLLAELLAV